MVWIWEASGPAADACGVAGTPDAARDAAGTLLESGRARAARVQQAALVDRCPHNPRNVRHTAAHPRIVQAPEKFSGSDEGASPSST